MGNVTLSFVNLYHYFSCYCTTSSVPRAFAYVLNKQKTIPHSHYTRKQAQAFPLNE